MYEGYKLCADLRASDICIVVEMYGAGKFTREFHYHIPKHRISNEARLALLRSLVVKFGAFSPEHLAHCHLNDRGKEPPAARGLMIVTSYPEPGVLRTYCGTDTKAWSDQVISSRSFRGAVPDDSTA